MENYKVYIDNRMENYKVYIDTDKPSVKIKFSISYLKPSESRSWATGQTRETGYRVTGVPIERSADGMIESYGAFTGFGDTLLPCKRRSEKRFQEAKKILNENLLKYIEWFENRGYNICTNAKEYLIEEQKTNRS